jgi:hypothetical protein
MGSGGILTGTVEAFPNILLRECVHTLQHIARDGSGWWDSVVQGIDVLLGVEIGGLKRFRGSIIPSKSEIKHMAGMVEWFARPLCPFTVNQTTKGLSVQFDYAKTMLCILRAFHLNEIGKRRSQRVALLIDGASLKKLINYCRWHQDYGPSCRVPIDKETIA